MLAMCLFFGQPYEEVARLLGEGLKGGQGSWRVPTTAAIGRARRRLGSEPLKALFARVCRPVAVPGTAGAWYRRWRLVAVDGTTLDLADTVANDGFFGRPGSGRGVGAFPQARMVAVAECGTHTVFGAAVGPLSVSEQVLSRQLFSELRAGMHRRQKPDRKRTPSRLTDICAGVDNVCPGAVRRRLDDGPPH